MISIANDAWDEMVGHARSTYPDECCGAMLGNSDGETKRVDVAIRLKNSFEGERSDRYELRPEDLLQAEKEARAQKRDLIGIYHSHPDCDAYFSQTDLKNSCPWYSFVVLSIRKGEFDHANSWLPDADQTRADREELVIEKRP
ncbi:MAG: M67 family metallopeptidase [Acidobacteria bacterium]|nr:M67 family metallopeptidase [Acidobacteriota bacterium]